MEKQYTSSPNRYQEMPYRRCGNSGLLLPAISLGLWHNFGHIDDMSVAKKIILKAFDSGITHFDLANNYGPPAGAAEENIGHILKNELHAHRDELIISTKAGHLMWQGPYGEWGSRKHILSSLDQSLKRLKVDYVDIFYSHRPDPNTPLEETMMALDSVVKQGKALYVGISKYSPQQTLKAVNILKQLGTPCLVHQTRYSMLERSPEGELLNTIEKKGMGTTVFSPLAQGLLTDKYLHGIPESSRAAKPHGFLKKEQITPQIIKKVSELNNLATKRGQSLAQMAIAWLLKDPRITSVIMGASSVNQLNENLKSLNKLDFTPDELNLINSILT